MSCAGKTTCKTASGVVLILQHVCVNCDTSVRLVRATACASSNPRRPATCPTSYGMLYEHICMLYEDICMLYEQVRMLYKYICMLYSISTCCMSISAYCTEYICMLH